MKQMNGLCSVLCSTYGRPELLGEAIWCFLQQTWPEKEMIIVNDKPDVIYHLPPGLPGITLFNRKERCKSLGEKRNLVKDMARGEYMFMWEDDDLSTPWRLEESVRFLQRNPMIDGVKSGVSLFSTNNTDYHVAGNNFEGSTCYRGSFLRDHNYDVNLSVKMDIELEKQGRFESINTMPLFWYIYRWGNSTHHLSGITDEKATWALSENVKCFKDIQGEIEIVPHFKQNYWQDIHAFLNANDGHNARAWAQKMEDCGVTI